MRGATDVADQLFIWHPRGWARGFLTYLHSPWGCDEPEILCTSNHQIGPIGADARHLTGPKQRVGPLDKPKTLR
jgi:hypothetical protein